ncbi:hypothetical protein Sjap_008918 [Stephania japonica]|uniref:Uncharacterized protein n=1 Tax=Stephania japonica TaxID=461633 RepID=A0AAP0PCU5_9MAGN
MVAHKRPYMFRTLNFTFERAGGWQWWEKTTLAIVGSSIVLVTVVEEDDIGGCGSGGGSGGGGCDGSKGERRRWRGCRVGVKGVGVLRFEGFGGFLGGDDSGFGQGFHECVNKKGVGVLVFEGFGLYGRVDGRFGRRGFRGRFDNIEENEGIWRSLVGDDRD